MRTPRTPPLASQARLRAALEAMEAAGLSAVLLRPQGGHPLGGHPLDGHPPDGQPPAGGQAPAEPAPAARLGAWDQVAAWERRREEDGTPARVLLSLEDSLPLEEGGAFPVIEELSPPFRMSASQ